MLLTVLLAGLAAGVAAGRPGPVRLSTLLPRARGLPGPPSLPDLRRPDRVRVRVPPAVAACALAGLAAALLVGGRVGVAAGLLVAVAGPRGLSRLEPGSVRREREHLRRDLPLALDLLAACLSGGATLPVAVSAVAQAVGGPVGARLVRVGGALQVGSPAAEAWAVLAEGDDPARPLAAPAVRALVRAGEGGAPVAAAVAALADQARAADRAAAEQRVRRAGVLTVLPLGFCFLPAFVLLGVVPVVVGLAAPLLGGL